MYFQGTLIQHLKEHLLHGNMNRHDTIIYYTTVNIYPALLVFILLLGSLLPPMDMKRDNFSPLELLRNHKYAVCLQNKNSTEFSYRSETRRSDKITDPFLEVIERRIIHV